jgi:hypothetical protein
MRSHARELAESPALTKIRQKVMERVALKRHVFIAIVIAVCIAMTSFGVYLGDLVNHGESDFDAIADLRKQVPVMYTLAIVMLATWWDERRKALRAAATEGELIAFYRKQLDREIRDERQLAFISLALGGLFFMGFGLGDRKPAPFHRPHGRPPVFRRCVPSVDEREGAAHGS